jgi:D-aspartate ligase
VQTRPPAVILGGSANAVSVARSLARAGVTVHAVGSRMSAVRVSRACSSFADLGTDGNIQGRWLEWLERSGPRGAVILPCEDDGLELIARNRPRLLELGYLPVEADDRVVLAMLDKVQTYELARAAGVPAPEIIMLRDPADADSVERMGLPCCLKPVHSHRFQRRASGFGKVVMVSDRAELEAALARFRELELEMLVTEVIPGGDDQYCSYYTYVDDRGEPLFHFTKSKIRQFPIHFGLVTYQVTDWNPRVAELGLQFFRSVGLRGIGNVEFKRDPRDGEYKLIECNHRFTAANELVRKAGIDISLVAYSRLVGLPLPDVSTYRKGMRMWHPVEDVRALRQYRRSGELAIGQWAASLLHPQRFPVFSWRDPLPTLANYRRMTATLTVKASSPAP